MKRWAAVCLTLLALAGRAPAQEPLTHREENYSVRNEVGLALDKGFQWLKKHQHADGSWSTADHPALTALPLIACLHDPAGTYRTEPRPPFIEKALAFLRSNENPDGSISRKDAPNYNTSHSLVALITNGDPQDAGAIGRARAFIIGLQAKGPGTAVFNGGIRPGGTSPSPDPSHADLSNTIVALEALRTFKAAQTSGDAPETADLDWKALRGFLGRCQNLPETNAKSKPNPDDLGGFISHPAHSNAAPADGSNPLRPYGSMTCAGLLALIYSDGKKDDPRIQAALDWIRRHYTVNENPGLGAAGYYGYLQLLAKALAASGLPSVNSANGRQIDWARELALKLIDLQNTDGSWANGASDRWMENDPVLATSYAIIALEVVYFRL